MATYRRIKITATMLFFSLLFLLGACSKEKQQKVDSANLKQVTLEITGMTCELCADKVQKGVGTLAGVKEAHVSLEKDEAHIVFDPEYVNMYKLKSAVKSAGPQYGVSDSSQITDWLPSQAKVERKRKIKLTKEKLYSEISINDLKIHLEDKDFLLVNVHIPYDGELPQTDLFIPYNRIEQNLDKLPQDKKAGIVVYCRSGHMSAIAAKTLAQFGYTNIYDVPGGMKAWVKKGNELLDKNLK